MEWMLRTENIEIAIESGEYVTRLINRENGWNWISAPSKVAFPSRVRQDKEEIPLVWALEAAEEEPEAGTGVLCLRYRSQPLGLTLKSIWSATPDQGPVEHRTCITNTLKQPLELDYCEMYSDDLRVTADSRTSLWNFTKSKLFPFSKYPGEPLADTGVLIHPFEYNSAFHHNVTNEEDNGAATNYPMLPFEVYQTENGHGLYFGHVFSFGHFSDCAGENPVSLRHRSVLWDAGTVVMAAGEAIPVPGAYIGAYCGDPDDAGNQMKAWFWAHRVPDNLRDNPSEPLIHVCLPSAENTVKEFLNRYRVNEIGGEVGKVDVFWLDGTPMHDADWPKSDFTKLPNWEPHPQKWPHDMTAGHMLKQRGMGFSLWMCDTYQKTYIGTPEGAKKEEDAIVARMDRFDMDTWRSDFALENRPFDYRTHMGLLSILDGVKKRRPQFRYEHCSGAAGLKDFSTLQRITVYTTEDGTTAIRHRKAFYTNSYMICPAQIKADIAYVTAVPNEDLQGIPNPLYDAQYARYIMRSSFLGAIQDGILYHLYTQTGGYDAEAYESIPAFQVMKEHWDLYRNRHRPIVRDGAVYHVLPMPDNINWDGVFFYNKKLEKGTLLVFKPSVEAEDGDERMVRLKGLERDARYQVEFEERKRLSCEATGEELMENGVHISGMKGRHASEIVWVTRL